MYLSELKIHQNAVIKNLPKTDPLARRLLNMGYCSNTVVTHLLSNVDLIMLQMGDSLIALKKSECRKILIE